MNLPKTILVATDFSETSAAAVEYAIALGTKLDAKIYVINAIEPPSYGVPELGLSATSALIESMVRENHEALDALVKEHPTTKINTLLRTGDARDMIVQSAFEVGADLIVMGTHGRRGMKRALLGSVAEGVLRHAHCPVLTIRQLN